MSRLSGGSATSVSNVSITGTVSSNIAQFGGTSTTLGQKTMANSLPVVLSSDQSAISVSQSGTWTVGLSAGSNTIGSVKVTDGTNTQTFMSTTTTSKYGADINVLSILGTAPTTAGKMDVKGADGDVFVRQSTATNLKTQAESYQGGTAVSSSNPLQVTLANTGANATAVKVDNSAVTQPISAASLPLPSGAATAAKQPALGTAGIASSDVITVQGIASMTALKVDGSAVTQPISASSLPLPTGAATSAKQDTGNTSVGNIDTNTTNIPNVIGTAASAIPSKLWQIGGSDGTNARAIKTNISGQLDIRPLTSSDSVTIANSSIAVTGTFWQATQPVSIADGSLTTLGSKADAKSTATDTTAVSVVSILKQISASVQAPPSQAVTNAGTFATQATLQSGSNLVGNVGIDQTTPGTTNAVTPVPASNSGWSFSYQSALSSTKAQIKGSAGTFGGYLWLYNPNTTETYIQVFNKTSASVTVGSTTPDFVIALPGIASASATGSAANMEMVHGIAMSTGITVAATTTATGSTAPSNAVVATFLYK